MAARLLVCGGRNFADRARLFSVLDRFQSGVGISVLIHGAARGADAFAGEWAADRGVPPLPFPADWKTFGKKAGPIRNSQMLAEGKPTLVIAFPGNVGTADMVTKARAAKIPIVEVRSVLGAWIDV